MQLHANKFSGNAATWLHASTPCTTNQMSLKIGFFHRVRRNQKKLVRLTSPSTKMSLTRLQAARRGSSISKGEILLRGKQTRMTSMKWRKSNYHAPIWSRYLSFLFVSGLWWLNASLEPHSPVRGLSFSSQAFSAISIHFSLDYVLVSWERVSLMNFNWMACSHNWTPPAYKSLRLEMIRWPRSSNCCSTNSRSHQGASERARYRRANSSLTKKMMQKSEFNTWRI